MPPRFCPRCGAPLEFAVQKFCTNCGATLPDIPPPAVAPAAAGSKIPLIVLTTAAFIVLAAGALFILPHLSQYSAVSAGSSAGGSVTGSLVPESGSIPPAGGTTSSTQAPEGTTPAITPVTSLKEQDTPATIPSTQTPAPSPTVSTHTTTQPTEIPTIILTVEPTSAITLAETQVPPQPPVSSYTSSTSGAPYIDPAALEARVHERINEQRQSNGLAPLEYDTFLSDIARGHSWDMVQRNFFEHINPDGLNARGRGDKAGYPCIRVIGQYTYSGIAENLYQGHRASAYYTDQNGNITSYDWRTLDEIAKVTVDGWMASPGHRANIVTPHFSWEGIGVAFAPDDKVYITENFC